jgi:hypothetical protein
LKQLLSTALALVILSSTRLWAVAAPSRVDTTQAISVTEPVSISPDELLSALNKHLMDVEEFRFIRAEAAKLGIRAYLFGGTAASYAHYAKWNLLREKGDPRYQPDRFDFDYTNIYRSTQDLDIVVDGQAEQAKALKEKLQTEFPYLQGTKTAWEVRLLREPMGLAEALLNNPDFLNQHTDSNSVGLIEITVPPSNEPLVRDLRDWESESPYFLRDILEGQIHFYFSPLHQSTSRYLDGTNPPIFSVIRYLTKAFQYDVRMREEDLNTITSIIRQFNPTTELTKPYTKERLESLGKKLIQHAVNIEYAWNKLEELGLRQRLIAINNNINEANSMAWWLNREPLRTYPLGRIERSVEDQSKQNNKNPKTASDIARELGVSKLIVAHETSDFLAYESITRAHTGEPNVLISREHQHNGETAYYGEGFYVQIGEEGARSTGFTIRFIVDPRAREGTDFIYSGIAKHLIFRNKAALKVIPESLNIGPLEYFQLLGRSEFKRSDLGIIEKLRRRIINKLTRISDQEISDIRQLIHQKLREKDPPSGMINEWFQTSASRKFPEDLALLVEHPQELNLAVSLLTSEPEYTKSAWLSANAISFIEKFVSTYVIALEKKNDKLGQILTEKESISFLGWIEDIQYLYSRQFQRLSESTRNLLSIIDAFERMARSGDGLQFAINKLSLSHEFKNNITLLRVFIKSSMVNQNIVDVNLRPKAKKLVMNAPAAKFFNDWEAVQILTNFNRFGVSPLPREDYLVSPLWKSRDWSGAERSEFLEILNSPTVPILLWKAFHFYSQIATRQTQDQQQNGIQKPGAAWVSYTAGVKGTLTRAHLEQLFYSQSGTPSVLAPVMNPKSWDTTSIACMRQHILEQLSIFEKNYKFSSRKDLLSAMTLPIVSRDPLLRSLILNSPEADLLIPHVDLINTDWLNQPKVIKMLISVNGVLPSTYYELALRIRLYDPTPQTFELLDLALHKTAGPNPLIPDAEVKHLTINGLILSPHYRKLLPALLLQINKMESTSAKEENLQNLHRYVKHHPSIITSSLSEFQDLVLQAPNEANTPRELQTLISIAQTSQAQPTTCASSIAGAL